MTSDGPRLDELLAPFRRGRAADAVFVEADGRRFTIAEFDTMVRRAMAWLEAEGIEPGDRVAVWLVNRVEWLALLFAFARKGVVLVAVNTRYRAAELRHILVSSGARLLIMQSDFRQIDFAAVAAGLDPAELGELERVAVIGSASEDRRILDRPTIHLDLDALDPASADRVDETSDPDAPLIFFTTSGTTKAPKLVVHPQRTLALHALRCATAFAFDADGAALLAAMPFCGVFGLNTVLAAIAGASTAHIVPLFETEDASRRIAEHRITHLFGSDEMFRRLVEEAFEKLSSARLCGFASFTPGLGDKLLAAARRGLPLCGLYGSSKVNAIFSIQPEGLPDEERLKGGGRPASADAVVRARDKQSGRLLAPFETGDLEIRAPTNFLGYFGNAEATEAAIDAEGFFRTGDVGYVRDDGTFVYVARDGDAIRLSGFLVDPAEIEDVLKGLDGVADAQVVGVTVPGRTVPVAFVIPEGDPADFGEQAVIDAAGKLLARFKVPDRVFPVEAFPATESANGLKIQKAKLREMAAARLGREEARS